MRAQSTEKIPNRARRRTRLGQRDASACLVRWEASLGSAPPPRAAPCATPTFSKISATREPLMSAQDPFYAVRDYAEAEVQALRVKFADWKLLLGSSDTYTDVKFRQKHEEVTRDLKKCGDLCGKVRLAVDKVEKNRANFSHIDERELGLRKAFVDRVDGVRG